MSTAQTEQVDERLVREVEEAADTQHFGMGGLVVVVARIGPQQLGAFIALVKDRYRDRARRTGRPYSKAKLSAVNGKAPFYCVNLGCDNLVVSKTSAGWDVCLTTVARPLDAFVLQSLLGKRLGVTAVTVLSSGEPVA